MRSQRHAKACTIPAVGRPCGEELTRKDSLHSCRPVGMMTRKALGAICLLVLCGILVARLWPFHTPKNEISWLSNGNGVLFGDHGSILSAGAFKVRRMKEEFPCSLEIWLQPALVDRSGTILAYYRPEHLVAPFEVGQSSGNLVVQRTGFDPTHASRAQIHYVHDLFSHVQPVFVTISSGQAGTTVYADGALVKKFPNFGFSSQDLTGQLLIGNAPTGTANWPGQLEGLAVYERELTAGEVSQHYADWTKNKQTDLAKSESVVALYFFNEGNGNVVRNQVDSATNLLIPTRFFVLHELFLEPFWLEFHWRWSYWKNVGINITGFIPLGFFFCAYFSLVRRSERSAAVTIAMGFLVSLTIEALQALLPTRDSGTTDLITNTFGTALGVTLWGMDCKACLVPPSSYLNQ
jgi:VanZ like family/Concanavalin A-like lectin/glucanases superfamily